MTAFDYAVIAIIALSAAVGWWRGFMYELFSLIGWVAAYIVAHSYAAQAVPFVPPAVGTDAVRGAVAFAAVFIVVLLVGAVFAWLMAKLAKFAGLSGMDGKFGAIFGMLRGVLVVLALVWLGGLSDMPQQPFWRDALSSRPLQEAAQYLKGYVPEESVRK